MTVCPESDHFSQPVLPRPPLGQSSLSRGAVTTPPPSIFNQHRTWGAFKMWERPLHLSDQPLNFPSLAWCPASPPCPALAPQASWLNTPGAPLRAAAPTAPQTSPRLWRSLPLQVWSGRPPSQQSPPYPPQGTLQCLPALPTLRHSDFPPLTSIMNLLSSLLFV